MRGGIISQANRYLGGFCSSQRIIPPQIIKVLLIIISLEAPSDARHTTDTLQDTIPSQNRSVEKVVYAREQHRIIMQAVQTLEQRLGAILIQHHGLDGQGGMSLAEIGRAHGLSRERVRQIGPVSTTLSLAEK